MKDFAQRDFVITRILGILYVERGKSESVHRDRASHGICINLSEETKRFLFSDVSYFSREFKKATGVNPSKYV